ncbi:MAG: acyltransferase family protein, partial [Ruminococcus sp.]|nr:acyltransferase family protein [Candidatus Copronaster equi]
MNNSISASPTLNNPAKKRIDWIDMAKGYGMILVIIGHIVADKGIAFRLISSFHMPLFFVLSGYLFSNKKTFKEFFIKKVKSLVVPYFCLCIPLIISKVINFYIDDIYVNFIDIVSG